MVRLLVNDGADIESKDKTWGMSPLEVAEDQKNEEMVACLIGLGARVTS